MGILVIQNKYNEEHSNAVVTHTYGNYNDAINAIKKFASKLFAVYNEGVDKDFDVKHRASQRDDINYFHAVCHTVADGVYGGDTRTQAFLQSISKSAKEFDTIETTKDKFSFVWTDSLQEELLDDVDDDGDGSLGVIINWYIKDGAIDFNKTTVDMTLCYEFTDKEDWLWDHSDADYEELPTEENGYREVSLHKILANVHSSYVEWRYDRSNSPVAYQK